MRKNNSRAYWWEARQMPRQWHPQGLGAGGRRPSQHNQLTQFDGSSDNVAYVKAGNATSMKPDKTGDWAEYYNLKWDAWNRLVEVRDSADAVVATYAYDGLTRRITKTIGTEVTHFYYNDQWKCVEERVDSSTDAERQYAWGIQFRNDLILRDRDTTGNGTLDERLYATHDALGNCTAILNTSGAVQERYGYSAFGIRRIMQADFTDRASSSFAWDFGFQGEFLDDETGYINYGFRYYMPYVGKWINRDPIEEEGGVNLYLMVINNAVNIIDFFGLDGSCSGCEKNGGEEISLIKKLLEALRDWLKGKAGQESTSPPSSKPGTRPEAYPFEIDPRMKQPNGGGSPFRDPNTGQLKPTSPIKDNIEPPKGPKGSPKTPRATPMPNPITGLGAMPKIGWGALCIKLTTQCKDCMIDALIEGEDSEECCGELCRTAQEVCDAAASMPNNIVP